MAEFLELAITGASFGAAFALLGLSINVIYSSSNILNFAQGEFMMLGGMLGWLLYTHAGLPYLAAFFLIALIVAALGGVEYLLVVWPLMRRRVAIISIIIATLGFAIVVRMATALSMGRVERFVRPPLGQDPVYVFGAPVIPQSLLVLGVVVVLLLIIAWFYLRTTVGLAVRAAAFEPDGARLSGVPVSAVVAGTFAAGGALAGAAGFLVGPLSFASPWIGLEFAIQGFAAAILGGLGSWPGAVIGGLILGMSRALILRYVSPSWGVLITFALILLILYIRPTGIFGERQAGQRGTV